MNTQVPVCDCQLRLRLVPSYETLPQVIQGTGIELWPYIHAVLVPSVPKTSVVLGLIACGPPSHPRGPILKTLVRLDRYLQCIVFRVLGSAVDCWVVEGCRCRDSREGLNQNTSVEHLEPLPAWKTYHPVPKLEPYSTHLASPKKARGRVLSSGPLPGTWGILQLIPHHLTS